MPAINERQLHSLQAQLHEREDTVREEIRKQTLDRAEASRDMIENVGDDADRSVADLIVKSTPAFPGSAQGQRWLTSAACATFSAISSWILKRSALGPVI